MNSHPELMARGWQQFDARPCADQPMSPGEFFEIEGEATVEALYLGEGSWLAPHSPPTTAHCRKITQPTFIMEVE